jgi:phosphoglycerate kinase
VNPKASITDLPDNTYSGKRVLVRTDFNVPLSPDGKVASDLRIRETLPTLDYLLQRGARVIIASHLGRPKGTVDESARMKSVTDELQGLMPGVTIRYVPQVVGSEVTAAVNELKPGEILVLENVRFEPGETKNDPAFAKQLAELADIYVNDAFGTAHRAHASTEGVAHLVPVKVAGLLMQRELTSLAMILQDPAKPFTAIVGGSKVSTKIGVLETLLQKVNNIVIGGGMLFTFLKAKGFPIGSSLVEDDCLEIANQLVQKAETLDRIIVQPKDVVIADRFAADAQHQVVPVNQIPDGWMGLDLGPESTERIIEVIKNSKTVFWNGPLGVFEFPEFARSTQAVAEAIATLTEKGLLTSVLGGGDTLAALDAFGIDPSRYTHVSTGGGATLELMEGKELPGVAALDDKVPSATGAY